jgi:putative transposase
VIASCRNLFPIRMMWRLLRVSPSGYYARHTRPKSRRARANAALAQEIRRIHTESGEVYGSPKIWKELQGQGQSCGQHRVARLMKQAGLQGIPSKKRWRTRKAGNRPEGVTNHLARDFTAVTPDTKWVTDITYSAPSLRKFHE